jgi:DNA-binding response OmpR family regulator
MLSNKTALIVEREMLIALDIERMLAEMHVDKIVTARGAEEFDHGTAQSIGLAVVDVVSTADEAAVDLIGRLVAQGVPVVVTSPDIRLARGVNGHEGLGVVLKPFSEAEFVTAVTGALERRPK